MRYDLSLYRFWCYARGRALLRAACKAEAKRLHEDKTIEIDAIPLVCLQQYQPRNNLIYKVFSYTSM